MEHERARCRLCGRELAEDPADDQDRLCGDCYWDDQTDAGDTFPLEDDDD